ncbi:hypothetical protein CSUI_006898, partial [Cystoisospora suis]
INPGRLLCKGSNLAAGCRALQKHKFLREICVRELELCARQTVLPREPGAGLARMVRSRQRVDLLHRSDCTVPPMRRARWDESTSVF